MAAIAPRLGPLFRVLEQAAPTHPELTALWREIAARRAQNMRELVADLAATGALRSDLSLDEAADVVWATNAPEFYGLLLDQRGWDADRFEGWLADAWKRLLLEPPG